MAKTPKQTPGMSQKQGMMSCSLSSFVNATPKQGHALPTPSLKRGTPTAIGSSRSTAQLIENFRQKLLENYRSIHDAFAKIDASESKDSSLSYKEFRRALKKLRLPDTDSKALFEAMDMDSSGEITWAEFLVGLTDVSDEALLWELRCRLQAEGITPENLSRVWDLITTQDDKKKQTLKAAARAAALIAKADDEAKSAEHPPRLNRAEWLRFGASLALSINGVERLFNLIDRDSSGSVELVEMFAALRTVAPHVSLERFVMKVLRHYRTLPAAFQDVAKEGRLGFEEFKLLAAKVDVSDHNAQELWEAREIGPVSAKWLAGNDPDSMEEEEFVRQLLDWSPDTALDRLRESLCEQFGNVVQGKKALIKAGVPKTAALTTEVFDAGLRAAGVYHCDAGLILSTVASYRRKGGGSPSCRSKGGGSPSRRSFSVRNGVNIDEVIGAIRATSREGLRSDGKRGANCVARATVGSDLGPYWQQLKALKNDVRRGLDGPEKLVKNDQEGSFQYGESGDRISSVIKSAVKQLAIGEAQNLAREGIMNFHNKIKMRKHSQEKKQALGK